MFLRTDLITRRRITARRDLQFVGDRYGGWAVPTGLIGPQAVCYCVGCGEDISFDLGLIEKFHCAIFAFDPTPRAIAHVKGHTTGIDEYHFSPIGLWDKAGELRFYAPANPHDVSHSLLNLQQTSSYIEVQVERLSDLMRKNAHQHLDLLKLDIEGAEYKVLDSIFEDGLDVRILCIEFDEYWSPLDSGNLGRIKEYVGRLIDRGYDMVDSGSNGNYTFVARR